MPTSSIWNFIQWVHYLALLLWVGSIAFFSLVVAPSVHHSVASKAVAGDIISKILKRLNILEFTCCLFLITTGLAFFHFTPEKCRVVSYLILTVIFMGFLVVFYALYLTPRLEALKTRIPTLEMLPENHPARSEFNHLHRLYAKLMSLNLVLGLMVLYASVVILRLG